MFEPQETSSKAGSLGALQTAASVPRAFAARFARCPGLPAPSEGSRAWARPAVSPACLQLQRRHLCLEGQPACGIRLLLGPDQRSQQLQRRPGVVRGKPCRW